MILQKIKNDAEDYLGEEITKAVITVPAYFSDNERQATKNAGKVAGFEVERIINEPTAAAMAYGFDEQKELDLLVFDLGGGTFDVSVLELGGGVYEVLATNGDTQLGGDDWDQALIDYVVNEFEKEEGISLREDRQAMQRLTDAAEEAKIDLTTRRQTTINLPFIIADDDGPKDLEMTITRDEFEELTANLVSRIKRPMKQVLKDTGYDSLNKIDQVLLIGGATRMPMIREKIESIGEVEIAKDINPDEAVALGASIQGGIISGNDNVNEVLFDVTPLSLGVEVKGGKFERVIHRNKTIPCEESVHFTTAEDNQTRVLIRVYQGEREIAEENEFLDKFALTGIPPAPAGVPRIKVTFSIDQNGIVHARAEDEASETSEEIKIESTTGLTEDEIKQMREEAQEYASKDERHKERIEAKNEAEKTLKKANRVMENYREEIDNGLRERIQGYITELSHTIDRAENQAASAEDLNRHTQQLEETLKEFGEGEYGTVETRSLTDE
jgi:molecular chaperone DnaK